MADGYALALQAGLVTALRADAGVSALVGARVYDEPPDDAVRPFVRLGNVEPVPLRTACGAAARVTFGIEVHSRPAASGRVEATQVAEAVVAALNESEGAVTVAGHTLVLLHWMATQVRRDDDGKSYFGIAVFEALLDA